MRKKSKEEILTLAWQRLRWQFLGIAIMFPIMFIESDVKTTFTAFAFIVICYALVIIPFLIYVFYFMKE